MPNIHLISTESGPVGICATLPHFPFKLSPAINPHPTLHIPSTPSTVVGLHDSVPAKLIRFSASIVPYSNDTDLLFNFLPTTFTVRGAAATISATSTVPKNKKKPSAILAGPLLTLTLELCTCKVHCLLPLVNQPHCVFVYPLHFPSTYIACCHTIFNPLQYTLSTVIFSVLLSCILKQQFMATSQFLHCVFKP